MPAVTGPGPYPPPPSTPIALHFLLFHLFPLFLLFLLLPLPFLHLPYSYILPSGSTQSLTWSPAPATPSVSPRYPGMSRCVGASSEVSSSNY